MMTIAKDFAAKAFVAFVAAAMMISLFAPAAKAQTAEQLQTMINDLLAQIATLQAQVGQGGQSVSSGVCPFTWTRDLNMGATGADVMKLQQFLNANADTRVSASGAGSVGAETEYYGPATAAAVAKMQVMYRAEILTPLGMVNPSTFFGPSTRAKANALCVAAPVEPVAPVEPTEPTEPVEPGVTLGDGEGSIDSVTQISSDDSSVREGESNGIFAFEADVSGDISVNRVDLYMDVVGSSTRASSYFQGASLTVDGEEVATLDVSDFGEDTYGNVTGGGGKEYRLRFSGLDLVFADGDLPEFQLVMDTNNVIDTNDQAATWYVDMETDSIRTVDGLGFSESTGASIEDNFGVNSLLVAELAVTEADNSPDATTFEVSNTDTTKDVEVAQFDVREKNGVDVTVDDMTFTITVANTVTNEATVVRTASVYDGSTKLASKTVTDGGAVAFTNMGLDIAADETVTLTIKLDFADVDNYVEGETVTVEWTSVDDAVDENDNTEGDMTITTGPVTSATHTLRSQGIVVTAGTFTSSMVSDGVTTANNYGSYKMNVEVAAFGDNYYVPLTTTRDASSTVGIAYQIEDSNGAVISTGTSTGAAFQRVSGGSTATAGYVKISDGSSATFELSVPFDPATTGTYRVQILTVGYALTAVDPTATETVAPAADFESVNQYVTS